MFSSAFVRFACVQKRFLPTVEHSFGNFPFGAYYWKSAERNKIEPNWLYSDMRHRKERSTYWTKEKLILQQSWKYVIYV